MNPGICSVTERDPPIIQVDFTLIPDFH